KKILSLELYAAGRYLVITVSGKHLGKSTFTRAVCPHDGVHFAASDSEVDAFQYFNAIDRCSQTTHFKHDFAVLMNHPTLPSSLNSSSLVASTANSIGNC